MDVFCTVIDIISVCGSLPIKTPILWPRAVMVGPRPRVLLTLPLRAPILCYTNTVCLFLLLYKIYIRNVEPDVITGPSKYLTSFRFLVQSLQISHYNRGLKFVNTLTARSFLFLPMIAESFQGQIQRSSLHQRSSLRGFHSRSPKEPSEAETCS